MLNEKILVTSEAEAWKYLEQAYNHKNDIPANIEIEFKTWPTFNLHLTGEIFQGTVSTSVMAGILELQNNFYRSYAEAKYGRADIRSLTQEDKDLLEINVKVKNGSTDISTILSDAFTSIAKELITKMTPDQVMIMVLSLGVLYFGKSVVSKFLDTRKAEKELDLQKFSQEQETERLSLMAEVAKDNSKVRDIREDAENSINALFKASLRAETIEFQGHELESDVVKKLVHRPRKSATDKRIDGKFLVSNVDAGSIDGHKIRLKHIETGQYLIVLVKEGDITIDERNRIQKAIWEKKPITLSINAKELRGEITSASIMTVGEIDRNG